MLSKISWSMLAMVVATTAASGQHDRKVTRLADGLYEIEHRDALDGFAGGNTTVIIGDRQVVVVDAPFLPSEAREDIAQIRRWTTKPVAFLITTHFHNDHNLGNRAYMDAFPTLTIIAHAETKREMDLFGPGSRSREQRGTTAYGQMLDRGTRSDGAALTAAEKAELRALLVRRQQVDAELATTAFQTATLTIDHDITIDAGKREVHVKYVGRGNTPGDVVVFLPAVRLLVAGDLVVHPLPFFYDGYPSDWVVSLDRLAQLGATTIVPGHGPILHDNAYLLLVRELLASAVSQTTEALRKTGPAMFRSVNAIAPMVDLSPFRARFAGSDRDLGAAFDRTAADLVKLVFREASLR